MEEKKLDIVRKYLKGEFAGATIEEKYDFDRNSQTFKIRTNKAFLLLKVGEQFLGDNNETQVKTHLENWQVANLLRENKDLGIFVGNSAPMAFNRFV